MAILVVNDTIIMSDRGVESYHYYMLWKDDGNDILVSDLVSPNKWIRKAAEDHYNGVENPVNCKSDKKRIRRESE